MHMYFYFPWRNYPHDLFQQAWEQSTMSPGNNCYLLKLVISNTTHPLYLKAHTTGPFPTLRIAFPTVAQPGKVKCHWEFGERALHNLSLKIYLSKGHTAEGKDSTTLHTLIQGLQ